MIILDTNVLSELTREQPNAAVLGWFQVQRESDIVTTSVTKAEVFFGLECMDSGKKRDGLVEKMGHLFASHFLGKVLPFDDASSACYATIGARAVKKGSFPGRMDTMIAAIAFANDACVATRNGKDFIHFPVEVIDPWVFSSETSSAALSADNAEACGLFSAPVL